MYLCQRFLVCGHHVGTGRRVSTADGFPIAHAERMGFRSPEVEGWVARIKTYKRRLLDALFETYRNSRKITIRISNIATVDVLGMCLYASSSARQVLLYLSLKGNYIHIGVGSDVVYSILIVNARASICGTDNSDDSTLFYVPASSAGNIKSPIWMHRLTLA